MRLGEYNTATLRDCVGDNDCVDNQFQDFGVEEKVYHPNYNTVRLYNDIALVRLSRYVEYDNNYYISPICMPWLHNNDGVRTYPGSTNVTVAGWGKTLTGEQIIVSIEMKLYFL